MDRGIFITGTDTGVGKTFVSSALLAVLRRKGSDAVPMKPVQSGCRLSKGRLLPVDLEFSLKAAGYQPLQAEKKLMCRYMFAHECSPHLAAGLAGQDISIEKICSDYKMLSSQHELVVVEGAGGVMVPVSPDHMMLDLMTALGLPVILVARTGLGTINHSVMSLKILKEAGLHVVGIVFNESERSAPPYIVRDNMAVIEKHGGVPVLGVLTRRDKPLRRVTARDAAIWNDELGVGFDIIRNMLES